MPNANLKKPLTVPENIKKPRTRNTSKKAKGPATSLDSLIKINTAGKSQHLKAARTRDAYVGYMRRAREFLSTLVDTEHNAEAENRSKHTGGLSGKGEEEIDETEEMMRDPEFAKALDGPPSRYTPQVIALFLAYHCFEIGNKKSTAEGIHAAFVHEYNHLYILHIIIRRWVCTDQCFARDGDLYRGRWIYNDSQGRWQGNPTHSGEVEDTMQSIRHKTGAEDGERKHSRAMSKEYMDMIYTWSKKVCPNTEFETLPEDLATLALVTEHLRYNAFGLTGFTVWTR